MSVGLVAEWRISPGDHPPCHRRGNSKDCATRHEMSIGDQKTAVARCDSGVRNENGCSRRAAALAIDPVASPAVSIAYLCGPRVAVHGLGQPPAARPPSIRSVAPVTNLARSR